MEELMRLIDLLPQRFKSTLEQLPHLHELVEIVLDLGRPAVARFPHTYVPLGDEKVSEEDLAYAVSQVGMHHNIRKPAICRAARCHHATQLSLQII